MASYPDRDAFVQSVLERIPSDRFSTEIRQALAEGIAGADDSLQREEDRTASTADLELRVGTWFLRDDDAPFFDAMVAMAPILAALVSSGLGLPAAVGAAASLGRATWRVWRKGGRLTHEQVAIVAALEAHGPLSLYELEPIVTDELAGGGTDRVREVLMGLQDVELADGTGASLVRPGADGRWRVVGV